MSQETKRLNPVALLAKPQPRQPWRRYFESAGWITAVTLLSAVIDPLVSPVNLAMLYLLGVVIAALRLGQGPAIVAAMLSLVAFNFFFVPPRYTLHVADPQYLITFASLLIVGLAISTLASQVRDQVEVAQQRETQTATLYALSRDLATAVGLEEIMQAVITHMGQTFDREVAVFLPEKGSLTVPAASPGFTVDPERLALATWAYERGQTAGRGTATFSAADARYLPLKTARGVVGVVGLKLSRSGLHATPQQRRLMAAFASQTALAIERALLAETARQAELLEKTEKLQTALFNSISHDLRTPLATITGSLSSLLEGSAPLDPATQQELLKTAHEEANRLNQLVGNLLDMSRLEAGALKVSRQPSDVQDVIGAALRRLEGGLARREVRLDLPDHLPLIPLDFVLMVQALVNILDNALKYSPPGTPLDIGARVMAAGLEIQIADGGPGLPPDDLKRIFDKFYRGPHTSPDLPADRRKRGDIPPGTGLGLSISSGIIEAHGGQIWAENRPGGGLVVKLTLPETKSELP